MEDNYNWSRIFLFLNGVSYTLDVFCLGNNSKEMLHV